MFWRKDKKADWHCAKCGRLNHPDGDFCEFCGQFRYSVADEVKSVSAHENRRRNKKCPSCEALCDGDASFCDACGVSLTKRDSDTIPVMEIVQQPPRQVAVVRCVHCGTMNDEGNRFCCHCSEEIRILKEQEEQSNPQETSAGYCPECGVRYTNEICFCNECGTKLTIAP